VHSRAVLPARRASTAAGRRCCRTSGSDWGWQSGAEHMFVSSPSHPIRVSVALALLTGRRDAATAAAAAANSGQCATRMFWKGGGRVVGGGSPAFNNRIDFTCGGRKRGGSSYWGGGSIFLPKSAF